MTRKPTIAVLIAAAGKGERFLADIPKQYSEWRDKAVLRQSVEKFAAISGIDPVLVVIDAAHQNFYNDATKGLSLPAPVHGGATRQESVLAGLRALQKYKPDFVLIHDAARPNTASEDIKKLIACLIAEPSIGFGLAGKSTDSVHRSDADGRQIETVERQNLWAAETPQGFDFIKILKAHEQAQRQNFTDDLAIYKSAGHAVQLIESGGDNFKLTYLHDLERLNNMNNDIMPRVGYGYDVHPLIDGKTITLAGIKIAHHKTLQGHSDADVVLHAITDALLGTCGAGDIGQHFPPSDQAWKNADSKIFLQKAFDIVSDHQGRISNIDVSILAEEPKISPYRAMMQKNIADILNLSPEQVNVKATTNEKMGFVGRGEGIAAHAVATVMYRKAA